MPVNKYTLKAQMDIPALHVQQTPKPNQETTSNNVPKMCGLHMKFYSQDGFFTDYPTGPCCQVKSSQVKLSFIVIPLHVWTYSGTRCRVSQDHGAT